MLERSRASRTKLLFLFSLFAFRSSLTNSSFYPFRVHKSKIALFFSHLTQPVFTVMKPAYYNPVEQSDDLDDPPVIVELVKPLNQNNSPEEDDWNKAKCAGVVGGLAGCFTGGFWLSVVCATGCIYAAKQEGTTSDIARACGTCAIKANVIAREVDEQYQVVDKSKAAAAIVWAKTKALNREHQLVEKTKDCIKSGVDYTREHKLVERTAKGMGTVLSTVAKELASNPIAEHGNETKNLASAEIMTTPDGTHDALTLV